MRETPNIGHLIEGQAFRDAIHVAVAPVEAGEDLPPGQRVALHSGKAYADVWEKCIGIVDPFLKELVQKGERFWLFLYPGSIESLRHVWTHPAFKAVPNG